MGYLSKKISQQQFRPEILGIFINPFYFVRKGLYESMKSLSANIHGKTLDAGCGSMPYRDIFKKVSEYTGLEYDSAENRKLSKATVFYEGTKFPLPDSYFDSAISTEVLEHVFEPDAFIEEIRRVLKPGARLILTCPFMWDEHSQPHDYARYSSFGLSHLLTKHGFKIIAQQKNGADWRAIFQIAICYIYKKLPLKNYHARMVAYVIFISPLTIGGIVLSKILPKNTDIYLSNVVLAQKS